MATKKELELEAQLMQTRIELIRAQNIILNNDFSVASSRLKEIEGELYVIKDNENKDDKENIPKKTSGGIDIGNNAINCNSPKGK